MRIKCQIKVVNRQATSTVSTCRNGGPAAQAVLFLAGKSADAMFLVYCTAKNKEGVKFPIKDNVMNIFSRFIGEGKATIQLKNPATDIFVHKAYPGELKILLNALKLAIKGETFNKGVLSSFAAAKQKHIQKPITKLIIKSRKDYPVANGFPSSLESLTVNECSLIRFDTRIFSLKNLSSLDLRSNKIQYVPQELTKLNQLNELILSKNEIKDLPNSLFLSSSKLCHSLRSLNVSSNKLTYLPKDFCNLKTLQTLDISFNQIKALPQYIGVYLKALRTIRASSNCIKFLTSLFLLPRLDVIDFFNNPFISTETIDRLNSNRETFQISSLQQLSARVIRANKIPYHETKFLPHTLVKYLDDSTPCFCQNFCFDDSMMSYINIDLRSFCENATSLDEGSRYLCPFRVACCSEHCRPAYFVR